MAPYNPGLEGVIVARTGISHVDGAEGRLIYRGGHLIEEIADRGYEEIVHLLMSGRLASGKEIEELRGRMVGHRPLRPGVLDLLRRTPADADPMDLLRSLLSAQGAMVRPGRPSSEDAIALTAVTATAVAACVRHRAGLEPVPPRSDLDHAANILYMVTGTEPDPAEVDWLNCYLVVMADHALAPSTFTAQIVGSAGSDLWSAVVAAVGTLKGPAHGGALAGVVRMLDEVGTADDAERFVKAALGRDERLCGFGHREYRRYDPRAKILGDLVKVADPDFYELAVAVETVALRELARLHPGRPNLTNVDYYGGGLLARLGFPAESFPCLFAAGRVIGWCMHVLEYVEGRNRIISPASEWAGPQR